MFTKFGQQGRLIRKRNRPLTKAEARDAEGILAEIRRVRVPGLDIEPACEEALA